MSSIFDTVNNELGPSSVEKLSQAIGEDRRSTEQALSAALPLLIGALASNSRDPQGAASLMGALDRDHDGSILDQLGSFLGRGDTSPGGGILGHMLGGRRSSAEDQVSQASGISKRSAGALLALLAPIVMGALARRRRQADQPMDPGGLGDLLGREREVAQEKSPGGLGGLASFLDRDGDGKIIDDALRMGASVLGGIAANRRR